MPAVTGIATGIPVGYWMVADPPYASNEGMLSLNDNNDETAQAHKQEFVSQKSNSKTKTNVVSDKLMFIRQKFR